jgi:hypothetical protein
MLLFDLEPLFQSIVVICLGLGSGLALVNEE